MPELINEKAMGKSAFTVPDYNKNSCCDDQEDKKAEDMIEMRNNNGEDARKDCKLSDYFMNKEGKRSDESDFSQLISSKILGFQEESS